MTTCREIITLQVGQAGNQVATQFWDSIRKEHGLSVDGKVTSAGEHVEEDQLPDAVANLGVMFNPTLAKDTYSATWIPRGILVDLEPGTMDVVKAHSMGKLFRPNNMISGQTGAGNNWAKGYYNEGQEIIDEIMDRTRLEVESCECLQGFQLVHSIGGGTGSGLGTLILNNIRDCYVDRMTSTYTVFPSNRVSDTVVEPYNAVLSTHQLIENSDETFILDNEAMHCIAKYVLKIKQPSFADINQLVSQVSCGISSSLRFPGTLNCDLRKLAVNLIPFPRLHFFMCSHAPFLYKESADRTAVNIRSLVSASYSASHFFCSCHPEDGHYMAAAMLFRGEDLREQEIDEAIGRLQEKSSDDFVEWIPNNLLTSAIRVPSKRSPLSTTLIGNTTAIKGIYQALITKFSAMYRRKAFLHSYKGEGMDEMEFQEAEKNVRDLIGEFQSKGPCGIEEDLDEESWEEYDC